MFTRSVYFHDGPWDGERHELPEANLNQGYLICLKPPNAELRARRPTASEWGEHPSFKDSHLTYFLHRGMRVGQDGEPYDWWFATLAPADGTPVINTWLDEIARKAWQPSILHDFDEWFAETFWRTPYTYFAFKLHNLKTRL